MTKRAKRVPQIGIVVWDLEKAVAKYEKYFGITEWSYADMNEIPVPLELNGRIDKMNIKNARAEIGNGLFLEIIQPTGEGEFMDFLKKNGPGIHHITFLLEGGREDFANIMKETTEDGYDPFLRAKMVGLPEGQGMDLTFLDLQEDMGAIIEIYNEDKE